MLRSLFSGISGMKNHQIRLDVIGNNIANVNTMGYKANRVVFKDVFSQTLRSGNTGQNPLQVGLGVALGSIDTLHTTGNLQSTGVATDLALEGNGFFMVMDDEGTISYTRAGNFGFDHEGYLVSMTNGNKVLGMSDFATSSLLHLEDYTNLYGNNFEFRVGDEVVQVSIGAGASQEEIKDAFQTASPYFDVSFLNSQVMIQTTGGRRLTVVNGAGVLTSSPLDYQYFKVESDAAPTLTGSGSGTLTIKAAGKQVDINYDDSVDSLSDIIERINTTLNGIVKASLEDNRLVVESLQPSTPVLMEDSGSFLDDIGITNGTNAYKSVIESDPQFVPIRINPNKMTSIKTISITSDGALTFDATEDIRFYDTDGNEILDYMNVAAFIAPNPSGLDKIGENQYKATVAGVGNQSLNGISKMRVLRNYSLLRDYAAGKTLDEFASKTGVGIPGTGGAGLVRSGFLEMSNVDLAEEFTNMIVTQRGFQANSRIITTSDEILQELVNLKR